MPESRMALVRPMNSRWVPALVAAAVLLTTSVMFAPTVTAQRDCTPGGPPSDAVGERVEVDGHAETLWLTFAAVGISTPQGYGQAAVRSPSPLPRQALLIDARGDGNHQIIVSTGREALLYNVSGCAITAVTGSDGNAFAFDLGHRRGTGDGIGCSDLGDGRQLVGLLRQQDGERLTVRRTEAAVTGDTAVTGRSDVVVASSRDDPVWTTAADITCANLSIDRDGVRQR
jgi:hypothetical protein